MKSAKAAPQVVIMKFGGSSLASEQSRELAATRVTKTLAQGRRVVVVVSALGRKPDPYATDSLLSLAPSVATGPNRDLLMASGELISAAVFASVLETRGVGARALTGAQAGIVTDEQHGNARVLSVDARALRSLLEANITPVVCGFQGVTANGMITTLGRGGSDLTGVALAASLSDAQLEIYTDVDGIMTADPKRVSTAKTIPDLTFEEVTELSEHGATVMHDKAADLARLAQVPYAVRNTSTGVGTAIGMANAASPAGPVTGVAASSGYTFMHVVPEAAVLPGGWEQDAFRRLAEAQISIDCVNVNAAGLFFIVRDGVCDLARQQLDALPLAVRARQDCAKISVVGAGMRGTPGVMYRCVKALSAAGVPIIHSTDSNITISLLVPGKQAAAAENALHDHFQLGATHK